MREIIEEKLREIEERENVTILYACESGSRAWDFASPDSDYDVRFVYVRKCEDYLRLDPVRDVIEWQLDETLDINGWDLQKMLRLLMRSNPTIFEWARSPIVYRSSALWEELSAMISSYFQSKKGLYHYLSMAQSNNREYLHGDMVRLKKYLYVLRPILACRWILRFRSAPPMRFSELCDAVLPPELQPIVANLLAWKMSCSESKLGARIPVLNDFVESEIARISEEIEKLSPAPVPDIDALNRTFLRVLKEIAQK